ncbi:MAG: carboxypeptidase regulatory-like domain-containing protein [Bacteroidota bacterium]
MRQLLLLFLMLGISTAYGQTLTQTVRGRIVSDTQEPLVGVQVAITNTPTTLGAFTDSTGNFVIEKVPVGRRTLQARLVGYSEFSRDNLNLNSAREYYIDIVLTPSLSLDEVVVKGYVRNDPTNELSVLSARRLDPEELQYHAATANDPGRLVQGMPGVQNGQDVRNEVVVRGNSPAGILWRLEGVDIPNPNHYAGPGSSGGGITIFSAGMLGSSDFSTGAFPAEYGNALSGVFDMRFRNGNKQQQQYTFRAGLLGLDFATEGPIVKGKTSYNANFRYSTLGILNQLGIYLLDPRNDNNFYDFSFKVHHQGKKSQFSAWGMGGISSQTLRSAEQPWNTYRDYYVYDYGTKMGVVGGTWKYIIDDKSYLEVNGAIMGQNAFTFDDTLSAALDTGRVKTEEYITQRATIHAKYKRNFSRKLNLKAGFIASHIRYDLIDEKWNERTLVLQTVIDTEGSTFQDQGYAQLSLRPNSRWMINAGLHANYYGLNQSTSIEPRAGVKFEASPNASFAFGYGLHSRTVPFGNYFILVDGQMPNQNLDLIKSHHFILAYDQLIGENFRLKVETYYQALYDIPVTTDPERIIFALNRLWGFDPDKMESVGTGTNYGIDLSIEKFFDKGSFFVLSGSWLNATLQRPNDPTVYRSNYDVRYAANFTGGQIFPIGENAFLETGLRFIYNSGYPITPIITSQLSNDGYDPPFDFSQTNSDRLETYFRPDLRVALRVNRPKIAYWLALDIQNFINRVNNFNFYQFDPEIDSWRPTRQTPIVPVLTFWLDF